MEENRNVLSDSDSLEDVNLDIDTSALSDEDMRQYLHGGSDRNRTRAKRLAKLAYLKGQTRPSPLDILSDPDEFGALPSQAETFHWDDLDNHPIKVVYSGYPDYSFTWEKERLIEEFVAESEKEHPAPQIYTTGDGEPEECGQEENVTFAMGQRETKLSFTPTRDITVDQSHMDDADLASFLSRPVQIASFTWSVGGSLANSVNPWHEFFRNTIIKAKIDKFHLLRCNLHCRVMINGTPFHVGKALVSWNPMDAASPAITVGGYTQLITYSQLPRLFIDASTSTGGCICLPFFWPNAWLDVVTDDFRDVGTLRVDGMNLLGHVSAGTDPVSITIMAWASDVKLCIPTTHTTAQSEKETKHAKKSKKTGFSKVKKDEHGDGIVSSVSSAVASAARELEKVPVIGIFAKATNMAANAVTGIARLFGFSRPVQLEAIKFIKSAPLGQMAQTNGDEAVFKMTIDPKQELTIDPRTVGLSGTDELSFDYIAGKETYFGRCEWAPTAAVGDNIVGWVVHPLTMSALQVSSGVGQDRIIPTAVGYLTNCFKNWSGTLIYRVQIIGSQYHRGRIAVSYDPSASPRSVASNELYQTTYTQIVDLDAGRDFEFAVRWCQSEAYLETQMPDRFFNRFNAPPSVLTDNVPGYSNGVINIRVVNQLVVPDGTTPVTINVFVRGGEDFELMNPNGRHLLISPFTAESEKETVLFKDPNQYDENTPGYPEPIRLMEYSDSDAYEHKPSVFFGERISSVRQLIKRYTFLLQSKPGEGVSTIWTTMYSWLIGIIPPYYGYDPNGLWNTAAAGNPAFNYVSNPYYMYFMRCYAGWRGSVRYKVITFGRNTHGRLTAHRHVQSSDYLLEEAEYGMDTSSTRDKVAQRGLTPYVDSGAGLVGTEQNNMPGLEFEIPFSTRYRFARAGGRTDIIQASSAEWDENKMNVRLVYDVPIDDSDNQALSFYTAAGEDFTYFFWVGAPVHYVYSDFLPAAQ